jgi:hypothetical protein
MREHGRSQSALAIKIAEHECGDAVERENVGSRCWSYRHEPHRHRQMSMPKRTATILTVQRRPSSGGLFVIQRTPSATRSLSFGIRPELGTSPFVKFFASLQTMNAFRFAHAVRQCLSGLLETIKTLPSVELSFQLKRECLFFGFRLPVYNSVSEVLQNKELF